MKVENEYDLICIDKCFDIHRVPLDEIMNECKVFIKTLKKCTDSYSGYSFGYLYTHSFSVLEQILDEYFCKRWYQDYD